MDWWFGPTPGWRESGLKEGSTESPDQYTAALGRIVPHFGWDIAAFCSPDDRRRNSVSTVFTKVLAIYSSDRVHFQKWSEVDRNGISWGANHEFGGASPFDHPGEDR